jgi:hypothetical protein
VIAAPDALMSVASDVADIGSTLTSAYAAAAAPTTMLLAAAQDEVSTAVAALFGSHGQAYQALSAGGGISRPVRAGFDIFRGVVCQR